MTSANYLTLLRILMVPLLVLLLLYEFPRLALAVFLLAGLTDSLDGYIARRFDQRSELGAILDPLADKALLTCSFVVMSLPGLEAVIRIPIWLTVVVLSRDILLVAAVILVNLTMGRHTFPPSTIGKRTTFAQLLSIFCVLLSNALHWEVPGIQAVFVLTLALTVTSGLHYLSRGWKLIDFEQAVKKPQDTKDA